ncbi:MAG: SigB/SigF/SigG family RNA polymerase sigma factor [Actinobacteria bacterium]|nr:MAG: SigB/SigF/SigG family RNA polymerase sigma factor [Actinomycetota bacterium]
MTTTSITPPCAHDDPALLFRRWQAGGDARARESLIEHYMPLARSLARRYRRSSEPFEDLVQVASLGLVKAVDRFDRERGHAFTSFAVPTILGELRRYFRDAGWAVHVPRGAQERALEVQAAQDAMSARSGRAPTVCELREYLELGEEEVLDALEAIRAYESCSIDAPVASADEDEAATYADHLGEEDERFELIDADATIAAAAHNLPPRERRVLHLRFAKQMTQTQIAKQVGVSQMQVSRLVRRGIAQLQELTAVDGVFRAAA